MKAFKMQEKFFFVISENPRNDRYEKKGEGVQETTSHWCLQVIYSCSSGLLQAQVYQRNSGQVQQITNQRRIKRLEKDGDYEGWGTAFGVGGSRKWDNREDRMNVNKIYCMKPLNCWRIKENIKNYLHLIPISESPDAGR